MSLMKRYMETLEPELTFTAWVEPESMLMTRIDTNRDVVIMVAVWMGNLRPAWSAEDEANWHS